MKHGCIRPPSVYQSRQRGEIQSHLSQLRMDEKLCMADILDQMVICQNPLLT